MSIIIEPASSEEPKNEMRESIALVNNKILWKVIDKFGHSITIVNCIVANCNHFRRIANKIEVISLMNEISFKFLYDIKKTGNR